MLIKEEESVIINPFSLEFGARPPEYIDRIKEIDEMSEDFRSIYPSTHYYAIVGPRGCGKTVLLNGIYEAFKSFEGWIAIRLNCKGDMLTQLAASIDNAVKSIFPKLEAEFSFSFSFLSLTLKGREKVSDIHVLLQKIFQSLSRHNIKVLVTVDDICINEHVELFAKEFQNLRGSLMPIFLVATGLYSIFDHLQSQEGLTFLQRAPKIYLGPLSLKAIASSYKANFSISGEEATKLAKFTKGYAYAYQVLGYLLKKKGKSDLDPEIIDEMDYYLEEGVYSKIAEELTKKEKDIIVYFNGKDAISNRELIQSGIITKDMISNYKRSLARKGIISISEKGILRLALPRLDVYLQSIQSSEG